MLFISRRMTIFLAVLGVVALAAVACSSDDPPATIDSRSPLPTPAPQPTATQAPVAPTPTTVVVATTAPAAEATTASASSAPAGTGRVDLTSDNFNWLVEEVGKGTK